MKAKAKRRARARERRTRRRALGLPPCGIRCPCLCHDTNGGYHDHPGQFCAEVHPPDTYPPATPPQEESKTMANVPTQFTTGVAGVSFRPGYPDNLLGIAQSPPYPPVTLKRDPDNPHDANAIEVHADVEHVGFVPGAVAAKLARVMDAGVDFSAEILEVTISPDAPDRPGLQITITKKEG